ncbi:hypothetical protein GCM10020220_046240 [Nonomuraea rubra]|uniref:hypothetical protein n=1 Tax=Nonomuraea rubra TaxID=46180 RepID=UPI0031EF3D3E
MTHHEPTYFGVLASWVERAEVDFVQVHYSIHTRAAEERVIRAAAGTGVAVAGQHAAGEGESAQDRGKTLQVSGLRQELCMDPGRSIS